MEPHYRRQSLNVTLSVPKQIHPGPAFPLSHTFSLDTGGFSPNSHHFPPPVLVTRINSPSYSIQIIPNEKTTAGRLRRRSTNSISLVPRRNSQPKFLTIPSNEEAQTGQLRRRSSVTLPQALHHNTHKTQQSINSTKVYSDTEEELDALEKMVKPRRLRNSFACLPSRPLPELRPLEPQKTPVFLEVDSDSSFERKKKEQFQTMKFLNLPKLPFGQHSSYNEETDIRGKIVSQRWKAWKRQQKAVPRLSF